MSQTQKKKLKMTLQMLLYFKQFVDLKNIYEMNMKSKE